MLVLKFGGTSVASPDPLRKVMEITKQKMQTESGLIVIVSAFSGVTDMLITATNLAEKNDISYKEVISQFQTKSHNIAKELLKDNQYQSIKAELDNNHIVLLNLLSGVALIQEASNRTLDYILSFGERNCAFILSHFLNQEGLESEYIDARKFIKTDDTYGEARVNHKSTNKLIQEKFANYTKIAVVTGFIGSDVTSGRTTTLGRGGSDFSAAIFAAALKANELQIWTDVSGVLTSDPRKVKKAYTINEMSYAEAMEMSHFGAKVLYYPTIRPVKELGIPTRIKNTFDPDHPGTLIYDKAKKSKNLISGLSSINDIAILSIEGSGLQGVSGTANRFFKCLATGNINVIMITQASSEHSISIAIKEDQSKLAKKLIEEEFESEIQRKLIDPICVQKKFCLLAVIGENMKNSPGVAGKLFSTLGKNGINIEAIAQGSSELNITFAIKEEDLVKALNTIHDSFFLSEYKTVHLFIIGVGLIGSTLIKQIKENRDSIKNNNGIEIVINGLSNSKKMLISQEEIDLNDYESLLSQGENADIDSFIAKMKSYNFASPIFIDNTASAAVPLHYLGILKNSIAISTPNKIALSSGIKEYKEIKAVSNKYNAPFLFETNVGAGLPVISTLNNLINSGDKITKIEAVLSGSVSYIFNTFNSSLSFSDIVKDAQSQGYTEPDPREDLSGADVKRKLLILARESGYDIESRDIKILPILSKAALDAESVNAFYKVLDSDNISFKEKVKLSESKKEKLRFIAEFSNGQGKIELKSVSSNSPFYGLSGSDNMIVFHSRRYNNTPLVIRGPGAGADVTAAGVLSEVINASFSL